MASSGAHTLKAFDEDLEDLRAQVAALGGWAEAATREAMEALLRLDPALAAQSLQRTEAMHQLAAAVDRRGLCIIALRAPMADDLREVLAAMKIAGLIERVGDQARSIAAAIPAIDPARPLSCPRALGNLARTATDALRTALNAFVARDPDAADSLSDASLAAETLYATLLQSCLDEMRCDPRAIASAINLLFVARSLARIADQAADLAGAVRFSVTGEDQISPVSRPHADLMERI